MRIHFFATAVAGWAEKLADEELCADVVLSLLVFADAFGLTRCTCLRSGRQAGGETELDENVLHPLPGPHHHTTRSCSERVSNPGCWCGRREAGVLPRRLKATASSVSR